MTIETLQEAGAPRGWTKHAAQAPRMHRIERRGSERIGGTAKLPALIRAFGIDPVEVCESAGVAPDSFDDPEGRITVDAVGRLLEASVARTGCPHFGLLAGRLCRLADWGPVGELARNCANVGEALRAFNAHQHLVSDGALTMLLDHGETVDFVFAMYVPRPSGSDLLHDAALAAHFNLLSELCGPRWQPTEICLPHGRPDNIAPYRNLFRTTVRFDSEICAVRFQSSWLQQPVADADPARKRVAERALATSDRPQIVQEVYRMLRRTLLAGHKGGDQVARNLSLHRRTLSRRLRAQGTTYQSALDDVRFSVASQLLCDRRITLDDIAANLGYASVNTFIRAFSRWTGQAPGNWRREQARQAVALQS